MKTSRALNVKAISELAGKELYNYLQIPEPQRYYFFSL